MHRYALVALTLLIPMPLSAQPSDQDSAAAVELKTPDQRGSYALGLRIGRDLTEQGVNLSPDAFLAGLKDAVAGNESQLSDQEMQEAMMILQRAARDRQAMKRIEADPELKALAAKNKKQGAEFLAKNAKREGVVVLPSGLQYEVIEPGTGEKPDPGDRVKVHYHGTLIEGTVFDSSVERKQPASFGVEQVIPGWTEALQLMKEGAKWKLYIPSDLAYGLSPRPGGPIGPNAVLIFEVELLEILD